MQDVSSNLGVLKIPQIFRRHRAEDVYNPSQYAHFNELTVGLG